MSNISAKAVKELREMTGAGMMDCKKALVEVNGDIDAAIEHLKKKGLAKAAKKSDRLASEGRVAMELSTDSSKATLTEINCETDFVSKNEGFEELSDTAAKHIHSTSISNVEELNSTTIGGVTFEDYLKEKIAKIGENIVVRRFVSLSASEGGFTSGYLHSNGRVGVVISLKGEATEDNKNLAKDICMHIAAMNPPFLNEDAIPAESIAKEEELAKEQLKKEGKPEKIWDKIIPGKIKKYMSDNTLLGQEFVKAENKESVGEILKKNGLEAVEFVRFELGEGLEKKGCDFASEVAAQLQ